MNKPFRPKPYLGPRPDAEGTRSVLLLRMSSRLCAVPLEHVVEIMRPQPVRAVPGMPGYVEGVALIRGRIVPVIHLASLLEVPGARPPQRLVALKLDSGRRQLALSVEEVPGVYRVDRAAIESIPPLMNEARPEVLDGIGRLDREFFLVLEASRILPDPVWQLLEAGTSS